MSHTQQLSPKAQRARRQMIVLARRFERGARVALAAGNPHHVVATREARSLRNAADFMLTKAT